VQTKLFFSHHAVAPLVKWGYKYVADNYMLLCISTKHCGVARFAPMK